MKQCITKLPACCMHSFHCLHIWGLNLSPAACREPTQILTWSVSGT